MKIKRKFMSHSGFTLAEVLVTIGIIVILLAVAIPAIAQASINFKMTELDATARQIFIAAQNNLTSMKVRGTSNMITDKGVTWTSIDNTLKGHYINEKSPNKNLVLPIGSIDDFIDNNKYTVFYNQDTNTVLHVFYSENEHDSTVALETLRGMEASEVASRRDKRLGYYNGDDLKDAPPVDLDAPTITKVINGERLIVDIESMDIMDTVGSKTELTLTVSSVSDPTKFKEFKEFTDFAKPRESGVSGETTRARMVLDSVYSNSKNANAKQNPVFSELLKDVTDFDYGSDIELSVRLVYTDGSFNQTEDSTATVTTNPLFESNKAVAGQPNEINVALARHLRNLDGKYYPVPKGATTLFNVIQTNSKDFPAVKSIAWPKKEIPASDGFAKTEPVGFVPINPNKLFKGYDGKSLVIKDIWLDSKAAIEGGRPTTAGLFGTLDGESKGLVLKGIKLENPSMEAAKYSTVGTLVGKAKSLSISNSHIYISDTAVKKDSSDKVTEEAKNKYKTIGIDYVGGMIGHSDGVDIKNSSSGLAYVQATGSLPVAGGLIGYVSNNTTKIDRTYAVCDNLVAYSGARGVAAMFVAQVGPLEKPITALLTVDNSYAVGNIQGELDSSGKVVSIPHVRNGFAQAGSFKRSYAAITYLDAKGDSLNVYGVNSFTSQGSTGECYYLNPVGVDASNPVNEFGVVISYSDLGKFNVPGNGFGSTNLTLAQSNPYRADLVTSTKKEPYPFIPIYNDETKQVMVHNGSWPVKPNSEVHLVYYEKYSDDTHGFYYYDSTDILKNTLKDNTATISNAGYGMLALDGINTNGVSVDFYDPLTANEMNRWRLVMPISFDNSLAKTGIEIEKKLYTLTPFTTSPSGSGSFEEILLSQMKTIRNAVLRDARIRFRLGAITSPITLTERNIHPSLGAAISPISNPLGTEANPYQVRTFIQLNKIDTISSMRENNQASQFFVFKQTHNIKADPSVGFLAKNFRNRSIDGGKDANGNVTKNTITGLTTPLFGTIQWNSKISNIHVLNSKLDITGTSGSLTSLGVAPNQITSALEKGDYGIFACYLMEGTIENSSVTDSSITSTLTGVPTNQSYAAGFVNRVGVDNKGLIANQASKITNSTVTNVKVTTDENSIAVGFVGNNAGTIKGSHVTSNPIGESITRVVVRSTKNSAFGFAGTNQGTIDDSSFTGNVIGAKNAAGFVGSSIGPDADIRDSKTTNTNVSANTNAKPSKTDTSLIIGAAGFVGKNTGKIDNSHVLSRSTPSDYKDVTVEAKQGTAHGFATFNDGSINNATFTGTVNGAMDASGFVGFSEGTNHTGAPDAMVPGNNAKITNSKAIDVKVTSTAGFNISDTITAAGFATKNTGTITNSHVELSSSFKNYKKDIIIDATKSSAYGFASYNNGNIDKSTFTGTVKVSSKDKVNATRGTGFVGNSQEKGVITNSKVIDLNLTSEGSSTLAGFAGNNYGKISNCTVFPTPSSLKYENVTISAPKGFAFGFVSNNYGRNGIIDRCSATGTVTGGSQATGFAQVLYQESQITNSYGNCIVVANVTNAAGFAQVTQGSSTIDSCYAMGTVKGGLTSTGFITEMKETSKIKNSYTSATISSVTGKTKRSGFANDGIASNVTNSYFIGQNYPSSNSRIAIESNYNDMISADFANKLNGASGNVWTANESEKVCFPYSDKLQDVINPFAMIKSLDHHGDWLIVPETPAGIVYYETYKGVNELDENGKEVLDKDNKPIPLYFIYGIDSKGKVVNNLKGNEETITNAGYGVLLPQGISQEIVIKYADGGTSAPTTENGFRNTFSDPFEKIIDVAVADDISGVVLSKESLRVFKRDVETALGGTIDQFDAHLSVPISITYGTVVKTYDIAPFSSEGIASLDLTGKIARTKFGTKESSAKVRTPKQLQDIQLYLGTKNGVESPKRYFLQSHDVYMKDPLFDHNDKTNYIIGTMFHNAEYDGGNNKITDSEYAFMVNIFATATVKNTILDGAEVEVEKINAGDQSANGLFVGTLTGGVVENSQVTNSSFSHIIKSGNAGFVGSMTIGYYSDLSGVPQEGLPKITGSSVISTKVTNSSDDAPIAGFATSSTGTIDACYTADITVSGRRPSGFVAEADSASIITNSYSDGTVLAIGIASSSEGKPIYLAGFVSSANGSIDNCYSNVVLDGGKATGDVRAGGFVGGRRSNSDGGSIKNSYSVSRIKGTNITKIYPFADSTRRFTVDNSYYASDIFGLVTTLGTKGTPLLSSAMTIPAMNLPATNWMISPDLTKYPFPVLKVFGKHIENLSIK